MMLPLDCHFKDPLALRRRAPIALSLSKGAPSRRVYSIVFNKDFKDEPFETAHPSTSSGQSERASSGRADSGGKNITSDRREGRKNDVGGSGSSA